MGPGAWPKESVSRESEWVTWQITEASGSPLPPSVWFFLLSPHSRFPFFPLLLPFLPQPAFPGGFESPALHDLSCTSWVHSLQDRPVRAFEDNI